LCGSLQPAAELGAIVFNHSTRKKGEQTWTRTLTTSKKFGQKKREGILNGSPFVPQKPWFHE
jgi:hypothetical protein